MALKIRKKTFRQQIKEPDEFISFNERALDFLRENGKSITIWSAVVVISLLLTGFFIKRHYVQKAEHSREMYKALSLANESYVEGLYDIAATSYEEIIKNAEEGSIFNNIAKVGLGYVYMSDGKIEESIGLFEELTANENFKYPKEDLYKSLAIMYEKTGKADKAAEIYKKLVARYSESPDISLYMNKLSSFGQFQHP